MNPGQPPPNSLHGSDEAKPPDRAEKRWWLWSKRVATAAFFGVVAFLIYTQARAIQWHEVLSAMRRYPGSMVATAAGLAAGSLLLYSCFDLLGRRYTGHRLGKAKVMAVTFVSYVFNLNLGSLVGGVALRYRLYTRFGLKYGTVTRILSMSMLTNWVGYILLAGVLFSWRPLPLPPNWKLGGEGLRVLGFAMIALGIAYLMMCAFSRQRTFVLRGHEIDLPSARMAFLQAGMGAANWLLIGSVLYVLLQQRVPLQVVASVLLLAAVAGVIAHVPAGLGVLEAVFVALLDHLVPRSELLAALVSYRLIYYLVPLSVAVLVFLMLEANARSRLPDRVVSDRGP
ncbi:MAG: lysylphosphatidylglycerol synthase domain-containing protein [Pseudomonadota bacterium]